MPIVLTSLFPILFYLAALALKQATGIWFDCFNILLLLFALAGMLFSTRLIFQSKHFNKKKRIFFVASMLAITLQVAVILSSTS